MGSGGIVRDLHELSRQSKPWEEIYDSFPSLISIGRLRQSPATLGNDTPNCNKVVIEKSKKQKDN